MPVLLLTFMLIFMIIRPVNLARKRGHERETDLKSLEMVCDPDAFEQAHAKLARLNRADVDPHFCFL